MCLVSIGCFEERKGGGEGRRKGRREGRTGEGRVGGAHVCLELCFDSPVVTVSDIVWNSNCAHFFVWSIIMLKSKSPKTCHPEALNDL